MLYFTCDVSVFRHFSMLRVCVLAIAIAGSPVMLSQAEAVVNTHTIASGNASDRAMLLLQPSPFGVNADSEFIVANNAAIVYETVEASDELLEMSFEHLVLESSLQPVNDPARWNIEQIAQDQPVIEEIDDTKRS